MSERQEDIRRRQEEQELAFAQALWAGEDPALIERWAGGLPAGFGGKSFTKYRPSDDPDYPAEIAENIAYSWAPGQVMTKEQVDEVIANLRGDAPNTRGVIGGQGMTLDSYLADPRAAIKVENGQYVFRPGMGGDFYGINPSGFWDGIGPALLPLALFAAGPFAASLGAAGAGAAGAGAGAGAGAAGTAGAGAGAAGAGTLAEFALAPAGAGVGGAGTAGLGLSTAGSAAASTAAGLAAQAGVTLSAIPTIATTAATTLGLGATGTAIAKAAITNGLLAEVRGGDFLEGAILGAVTAGISSGLSAVGLNDAVTKALSGFDVPANVATAAAKAVSNTVAAATVAGAKGGDVGAVLLRGLVNAGADVGGSVLAKALTGAAGETGPLADAGKFFKDNPVIANAMVSSLGSGLIAAAQGGDVDKAIYDGAASSLVASGIAESFAKDFAGYIIPVAQAAVTGGDVERALQTSIVTGAVDFIANQITTGQKTVLTDANKKATPVYKDVDFAKESFKQTFGQTLTNEGAEALLSANDPAGAVKTLKTQQEKYGVSASDVTNWLDTGKIGSGPLEVDFAAASYRQTFGQTLTSEGAEALSKTNNPGNALKTLKEQQEKYRVSPEEVTNWINTSQAPLGELLTRTARDWVKSTSAPPEHQNASTYWRIEDADTPYISADGGVVVVGKAEPGWEWSFEEDGSGVMWNRAENIMEFLDAEGNILKTMTLGDATIGSFIAAAKDSIPRGGLQLAMLLGDVLPAYVAKVMGPVANENYFKRQMREAVDTIKKINNEYPLRVSSYKDINGFGDAATYTVESVLEGLVSTAPTLLLGGGAGVAARSAAKVAVDNAVKKELAAQAAKGVFGEAAISAAQNAAMKAGGAVVAKYTVPTLFTGSAAQNIPEVFLNVYEAKEGNVTLGDTAVAGVVGAFNGALDAIMPAGILKKLNLSGIPAEEVIGSWFKKAVKEGSSAFAKEASTEALQNVTSAAAESFVADNKDFFTSENLTRFIDSGLRGGLGGAGTSATITLGAGAVGALTPQQLYKEGIALSNATPERYQKVIDEFKAKGYTNPTAEDISTVFSTKPNLTAADIASEAAALADTRVVTEPEVRQMFANLGYTPTQEEVAQYVRSGPDVVQADTLLSVERQINAARDTRIAGIYDYVDAAGEETKAQFDALSNMDKALVATQVEQGKTLQDAITKVSTDTQAKLADVSSQVSKLDATTKAQFDQLSNADKQIIADQAKGTADLTALINTRVDAATRAIDTVSQQVATLGADAQAKYDQMSAQHKADVALLQQQGIRLEDAINTKYGELQQQFQAGLAGVSADAQAKYDQMSAQHKADVALLQQQGIRLEDAINTKYGELQQQFQTGFEGVTGKLATLDENTRARFNQLDKTTQDLVLEISTTAADFKNLVNTNYDKLQEQITGVQTGVGQQIADVKTQVGQQITGVQTSLEAQLAQQAQQAQRQSNVTQLFNMLSQPGALSQKVEVKAAEPVRLGPMFDISGESIFGAGQQLFTPYSAGGAVNYDEITDELVKIIRG